MEGPIGIDQRPIVLNAARALIAHARDNRAHLRASDPARHFYLGVDAAANEVLHPELQSARADGWLDHEPPSFREGYLKASILLAEALVCDTPPLRILMPEPDPAA
jgi:hypothetical protein